MPEISSLKSKVPMLPSQGISYAKYGAWMEAFSACLTLKGLHRFAALDSAIPTEFPEVNEDEDDKSTIELFNVLTLQYKVANKYDFAANSAEAYALLYKAATHNVQIQRAMKMHKENFPLAFALCLCTAGTSPTNCSCIALLLIHRLAGSAARVRAWYVPCSPVL